MPKYIDMEKVWCGTCDYRSVCPDAALFCKLKDLEAIDIPTRHEKGCEYCNNTEVPEDWRFDSRAFIVGDVEYIPASDYYYSFMRNVKFCPKCGRRLSRGMSNDH